MYILSAVTGRDLQAFAQREDGWCESLQRGRSVAREPVEMKQGSIPVSFRRLSPLSLVECVSSLAEQTKSGGTASFRPDTKGRFFYFAHIPDHAIPFERFLEILKNLFAKSFLSGVWGRAPI